MCGILGSFLYDSGDALDVERLQRQVAALSHRGPDDSTCWSATSFFFGHRRLSIIDLSDGRQPMATEDGRLVVTFNGEIYNYVELRDELIARGHRFRTASDTEVLLHGYVEWGSDMPAHLVGMFAFAIADRRRHELFMARDRFGEKPLLYCELNDRVLFASELSPLSALHDGPREMNTDALPGYLCLNYVAGEDTLLKGVRRVVPGSWRLYGAGGLLEASRYWVPPSDEITPAPSMAEAIAHVERLLDESTRLALRSDVPVGMFLSGGIDSALVARFASEVGHLSHAFCLTFDESSYSEWDRASLTARQLGIPLTRVPMGADAITRFLDIVRHGDDPLADSSSLAVWTLAREAGRHVKVVLSGDGGDELFGGYLTYKATACHAVVTSRVPLGVRRFLAGWARYMPTREGKVSASYKAMRFLRALALPPSEAHFSWNGVWMPEEAAGLLRGVKAPDAARAFFSRLVQTHGLPPRPTLRQLQRADVSEYLPNDILAKADRMSMAHGLEVRAPFLNPALADYALRLPARLKVGATGPTKRVLRALARARYGKSIALAGKQGFSIPIHGWLRGPARDLVDDLLAPASIARIDALDPSAVSRAVSAHMAGRRSLGFELWGLMVLVAWHRRHIQAQPVNVDGPAPSRIVIAENFAA